MSVHDEYYVFIYVLSHNIFHFMREILSLNKVTVTAYLIINSN